MDPFPPPNNGAAGDKFTVQEVLDVHELANMTSDFRATTAESGEWFNSVTSDVAPAGFASSDTTEADGFFAEVNLNDSPPPRPYHPPQQKSTNNGNNNNALAEMDEEEEAETPRVVTHPIYHNTGGGGGGGSSSSSSGPQTAGVSSGSLHVPGPADTFRIAEQKRSVELRRGALHHNHILRY